MILYDKKHNKMHIVHVSIQAQLEGCEGVRDVLWRHCHEVLDVRPSSLPALTAVAYLTLEDIINGTSSTYICT